MSKELDEIKSIVFANFGALGFYNPTMNDEILKDRDKVLNYLSRFESIDNADPSEALQCLEEIENYCEWSEFNSCLSHDFPKEYNTIKQALIKAQEQSLKDKAFELIILKNVDVNEIRPNATAKDYNSKIPYYRQSLTDDEFKFLKEMFHRLDCEKILFELPKKNMIY